MAPTYQCTECGKQIDNENGNTPTCCQQPMKKTVPMDYCTTSSTAEHSRLEESIEPCDDGRKG